MPLKRPSSLKQAKGDPADGRNGTPSIRPSSIQYFYGRITREEAELFLTERGGMEGLFLLRESISPMGNYAVSICHASRWVTKGGRGSNKMGGGSCLQVGNKGVMPPGG